MSAGAPDLILAKDAFCQDQAADGPTNMARDAALLRNVGPNQIFGRLYEWDAPWVTVGRFQRAADYRLWVRRPTGGRAVFHGEDWTVAIAAGLPRLEIGPKQIRAAYQKLTVPIIAALRACDADVTLAERTSHVTRPGPAVPACFSTTAPLDLVDPSGHKVCGIALRATDSAVLLQASIPRTGWEAERFPTAFGHHFQVFAESQT